MSFSLILAAVTLTAGMITYIIRSGYPRPLPGIPYNPASAARFLGDVPDLLKFQNDTGELWSFFKNRCVELNSPVVQVFTRPWQKPWIVLVDAQEQISILTRRHAEFDRSDWVIDFFKSYVPDGQITLKTDDHWRANRRLVADTLRPEFQGSVARHQIYSTVCDFVSLWREKMRLSDGRAFDAIDDITRSSLESINATTLGLQLKDNEAQRKCIKTLAEPTSDMMKKDGIITFPSVPPPENSAIVKDIMDTAYLKMKIPIFPDFTFNIMKQIVPSLSSIFKKYQVMISKHLDGLRAEASGGEFKISEITCAAELFVQREVQLAKKEGRSPDYKSQKIRDELFGFLSAGYESSACSVAHTVKLLTKYQVEQEKLRKSLKAAFPNHIPNADEILAADLPYLDAIIEETFRYSPPVIASARQANVDTTLLGHVVPKGTEVFMINSGPSHYEPSFPIPPHLRDEKQAVNFRQFDSSELTMYKPERWLVKDDDGKLRFDGRAGPMLAFGAGPRGCFGQKLARITMRIVVVMLFLHFKLLPLEGEISKMKVREANFRNLEHCYVKLETA